MNLQSLLDSHSFTLQGVTVIDPLQGTATVRDLTVANGLLLDAPTPSTPTFDASSLTLFPPLSDLHVHARDNILAAGSLGGFGHLVTMANQTPAIDSVERVHALRQSLLHPHLAIHPSACVTQERAGHAVADLEDLAHDAGVVAFTDDGTMVADDAVMAEAMTRAARLHLPIMDHAMIPSLMGHGVIRTCPTATRLGLPLVPPETEVQAVARDIALSRQTGCAIHLQHISCAGSVELIRAARAEGLPVSGEATPHHLLLSAEDIPSNDANWKMNPPLGTRADRDAVRDAVLDGTLSVLATDHAPHPATAKARGFLTAPFGIVGLETALGASYVALVEECGMSLVSFLQRWTTGPAEVVPACTPSFSLKEDPCPAFILADFHTRRPVNPALFVSGSTNTPFTGRALPCVHGGLYRYFPS